MVLYTINNEPARGVFLQNSVFRFCVTPSVEKGKLYVSRS